MIELGCGGMSIGDLFQNWIGVWGFMSLRLDFNPVVELLLATGWWY